MRILITGGSGVIGSRLTEAFVSRGDDVHYTFLNNKITLTSAHPRQVDITEKPSVLNYVKRTDPDVVIHTVAVPSTDVCETNKKLADTVNTEGTRNIIDACKQMNSTIVFVSTSHVFDGKDIYQEEDIPHPVNYYGLTKLEGEKITTQSGLPFLILRTDQPYGWVRPKQKQNTVTRMLKHLEEGKTVTEIVDWYNTPTFTDDFVHATTLLIQKNKTGIYHLVGPEFINRFDWGLKIADVFGQDKKLVAFKHSDSLHLPAQRPNAHISNKKVERNTGYHFSDIREGLKKMKKQRDITQ